LKRVMLRQSKRAGWLLIIALPVAVFATLFGCGGDSDSKNERVLIIGVEGISWETLDRYSPQKELTAFQKFKEEGAWGVLESLDPVSHAAIWASLATGKTQTDHGIIRGLTADGEKGVVTPNKFECLPLWEILAESGVDVAQIGWPGSHKSSVSPLRVSETDAYSPLGIVMLTGTHIWRDVFDVESLGKWFAQAPSVESLLNARIARNALDNVPDLVKEQLRLGTDVVLAFFDGPVSARHHDGAAVLLEVASSKLPRPQLTVDYLRELNAAIDDLLAEAGDGARVFLVTDTPLPPADYEGRLDGAMHPIHGIFAVMGPGIAKGKKLENPTVLDLVPTALALLGLRAAKDMPGRVIEEIFENPTRLPSRIPTYEVLSRADYVAGGDPLRHVDLDKIRHLSEYSDTDLKMWQTHRNAYARELILAGKTAGARNELDMDARRNAYNPLTLYPRALVRESVGLREEALENLDDAMGTLMDYGATPGEKYLIGAVGASAVRIRLFRGEMEKAGQNLEWAAARAPDAESWDLWRVRVALAKGRKDEAAEILKSLIDRKGVSPEAALLQARINLANDNVEDAMSILKKALRADPDHCGLLVRLGYMAYASRDFAAAVSYYQRALATGKANVDDMYIYASTLNSLSRTDESLDLLEEIIRSKPLDRRAWTALRQIVAVSSDADEMIAKVYRSVCAEHFAFQYLSGE
jgi:tetratricopeptide (TPR) repeat protein